MAEGSVRVVRVGHLPLYSSGKHGKLRPVSFILVRLGTVYRAQQLLCTNPQYAQHINHGQPREAKAKFHALVKLLMITALPRLLSSPRRAHVC